MFAAPKKDIIPIVFSAYKRLVYVPKSITLMDKDTFLAGLSTWTYKITMTVSKCSTLLKLIGWL